jgi:hypothetical protein
MGGRVLLTAYGLIYASSMMMLDSACRKASMPALARRYIQSGVIFQFDGDA